ncbi:MAG: Acryloyl-CoA reductase electron transfer subunit gamma [Lentisphaerae bacterium ADurb.BinA184]|nr:MAG: Acryloyl-CoA reductase electron transfer subunit gamma [Lentisphaerae bacterium ADurb.BinA184]
MSLTILVFAKQVPDTKNITGKAMKDDGTVNRAALPAIFNPEDLNGVELALALRERYGGKVVVATMGPPAAANILRHALYMGADESILLTDRRFAGADTLATSYTLAAAARKAGPFDLVICGRQAIDGDTAQVGPQLAEKLNIPQLIYVAEVESVEAGRLRGRCLIDGGYEIIESPLPCLLTVVAEANVPRPAGARRLMQYKRAVTRSELLARHGGRDYEDANVLAEEEASLRRRGLWIHEWTAGDLAVDPNRIGMAGSPTKVKAIQSVVLTGKGSKQVPPTDEGIAGLVHELIAEHILS